MREDQQLSKMLETTGAGSVKYEKQRVGESVI